MKFASFLLFALAQAFASKQQLLKPIKSGPPAGLVLIQGAQIPSEAYLPLAQAIQNASELALYIVIPAYFGNVPEPLQLGSGISGGIDAMHSAGLTADAPIAMGGHSLGGAMLQDYVYKCTFCKAQILMGSGLLRKYRNGSVSKTYPVPTCTIDGTLDGLMRVTRQAETFYWMKKEEEQNPDQSSDFPVIIYPGVNHMQFASGTPPFLVKEKDLKPAVADDVAHAKMGVTIANYLNIHLNGVPAAQKEASKAAIVAEVAATEPIMQPIVAVLEMEAYHHFKPACNSDYPMPQCPFYPRYPSGQQGTTPQTDCSCGNPWAVTAQKILAGVDPSVDFEVQDAMHPVSDITPIHLPKIWSPTCASEQNCEVNSTTVTYNYYSSLDGLDTGFSQISAYELKTKLKSRQSMWLQVGRKNVNFTETDVVPSLCAQVNQHSYDTAMSMASPAAKLHFAKVGQPLVMGDDIFHGNAGPIWIESSLKYTTSSDKSHVTLQAPCSHTPVDYSISSAAGFHYCKLLSPAAALEWIYIDGLRAHGGL